VPLLAVLMLLLNLGRTTWNLFNIWPNNEEVQFVWQASFTAMAEHLDIWQDGGAAAVGGWTPETMDPPTMALLLHNKELSLRYFDPTQSLILPASVPGEPNRLLWPTPLPLAPDLEQKLSSWGGGTTTNHEFAVTIFSNLSIPSIEFSDEITFGDEITFLGYELLEPQNLLSPGTHRLLTYWRVERPTNDPRRFFLHLVDEQGQTIVQQDTLGAPAEHWQPGDLILQLHTLEVPPTDGPVSLLLGLYNPTTNQRLTTAVSDGIYLSSP
jgi:hypothetical protein